MENNPPRRHGDTEKTEFMIFWRWLILLESLIEKQEGVFSVSL